MDHRKELEYAVHQVQLPLRLIVFSSLIYVIVGDTST